MRRGRTWCFAQSSSTRSTIPNTIGTQRPQCKPSEACNIAQVRMVNLRTNGNWLGILVQVSPKIQTDCTSRHAAALGHSFSERRRSSAHQSIGKVSFVRRPSFGGHRALSKKWAPILKWAHRPPGNTAGKLLWNPPSRNRGRPLLPIHVIRDEETIRSWGDAVYDIRYLDRSINWLETEAEIASPSDQRASLKHLRSDG